MKKLSIGSVLALCALMGPVGTASASDGCFCCPWAASAAFPTVNPPGWYTNTYSFAWYYPWYAYYNFSQGPYANWAAGKGYASYGFPKPVPPAFSATVTITLPADAKLLFSGVAATGTGAVRFFATPPLEPNQDYGYEMTAEVVKDGRTLRMSKVVIVHAGDKVQVKFDAAELKEFKEITPPPPVKK